MKVSIITACFNAQDTIEETIKSILNQTYSNIEYIIVDGASTDNTIDIAKQKLTGFKGELNIISEPDTGVYNAMNKGVKAATGDLILFLNADDILINELVIEQFAQFAQTTKAGLLLGNIILLDRYDGRAYNETQPYIDKFKLVDSTVFHPATFFRREVFEKYGLYNEENKIVSDYEWYLNYFVKNKGDFAYLKKPISIFAMGEGLSSDSKHGNIHKQERLEVQNKYFSPDELKVFKWLKKLFPRMIYKTKFRKKLSFLGLNEQY